MNGPTDRNFVLDTNFIIEFTERGKVTLPDDGNLVVSVMTEIEFFCCPSLAPEEEQRRREFIKDLTIMPLNERIKHEAIRIRRFGSPRLKLPDAIIAATAVVLEAELLTNDGDMLKLDWPGLRITGG